MIVGIEIETATQTYASTKRNFGKNLQAIGGFGNIYFSCPHGLRLMFGGNRRYGRGSLQAFYIRANRCSSFYDSMFALTGWKTVEINGIEFELNSILVEKWKGKPYRLVIQRQRRIDGDLDIWEGEYTYRCILTNDYKSSARDIVEFYNLRGGKERIFDDMNNDFGWNRLPNRSWHRILYSCL